MNRHSSSIYPVVCLATALCLTTASADTVTYQQGFTNDFVTNYQGTDDTFASLSNPMFN